MRADCERIVALMDSLPSGPRADMERIYHKSFMIAVLVTEGYVSPKRQSNDRIKSLLAILLLKTAEIRQSRYSSN